MKQSVSKPVTILFPELEKLVSSLHGASVYALLSEYPEAKQISAVHLTKMTNLLATASKGRYGKEKAIQIRDAAKTSIGSVMPAKSLELSCLNEGWLVLLCCSFRYHRCSDSGI